MNGMRPDSDRLTVNCNPTAKSLPILAGLRGIVTGATWRGGADMRRDADCDYSVLRGIRADCRLSAIGIGAAEANTLTDLRDGLPWKVVSHVSPDSVYMQLPVQSSR